MIRAYKYRLYPNAEQKAYFAKAFGCTRYAYNYYVREHERIYEEENKTANEYDLVRSFCFHKLDKKWLRETDSSMLNWAAMRVINGWDRFFDNTNIHPPHEHKKGERSCQSYTTSGAGLKVIFRHNTVRLPIIGEIRARLHRRFYGDIKCATIKQTAVGDFYISLYVDERKGQIPMKPFSEELTVGVDVGVRHFLTLSDGSHFEMPDVSRLEHRRVFLQRRLKKQKTGSKGYMRTKHQIARINEHISNIRLDFHHKAALDICRRYDSVCIETLNVEGMRRSVGQEKDKKTNGFNRKLSHVGLGHFIEILENKAITTGTHFARIDRWEPTSKTCHACGYVLPNIDLNVEEWTCPECGIHHDRDVNAAINIRNKGLEILPLAERKDKPETESTAADQGTGKMAADDDCRPSTQIEEGTAPPRLAYNNPLPFLKISPFARKYGLNESTIRDRLKSGIYKNIRYWQIEEFRKFFDALLDLAKNCRKTRIYATDRTVVSKQLGEMNKLVNIGSIIVEVFSLNITFTWWRQTKRTQEEIDIVNRIYSQDIPESIEKFVERYRPT